MAPYMDMRPRLFSPLTPEALNEIDSAARQILVRVGIKIIGGAFLDKFNAAGASVDNDVHTVRFDGGWLDEMLARAPSSFTLFSRDGRTA